MKVTFFGTTTLLFDDGTDQILFDAHITRPSLLDFLLHPLKTDEKLVDSLMKKHRIHRLKAVFISHTHHDHVMDAPYIVRKTGAKLYGSSSAKQVALGGDVPEDKIHVFHPGDSFTIGKYHITILASRHSKPNLFNNDLGQEIKSPVVQPARKKEYKEGGSYDFLIHHGEKSYLIRPSFHYVKGELDHVHADVLFLGIGGLSKADAAMKQIFYQETVEKADPGLIIPIHWENFFTDLRLPVKGMPVIAESTPKSLFELTRYCEEHDRNLVIQLPLSHFSI